MKKPLPDRIAALRARKEEMAARLARLETRAKQADRKRDTRRKIVVGAAVLSEMERTPMFAKFVRDILAKAVTRPQDIATIADLLQATAPIATPPAANSQSAPMPASEQLAG